MKRIYQVASNGWVEMIQGSPPSATIIASLTEQNKKLDKALGDAVSLLNYLEAVIAQYSKMPKWPDYTKDQFIEGQYES